MTKARRDGLYLLALGSLAFVLFGLVLENAASAPLADFRGLYYTARCFVQHCDPYLESDVLRVYKAENASEPFDTAKVRQIVTRTVYPPTVFSFTILFGLLPWSVAHTLWIALTIGSLVFSSFLIWNLGADYAPLLSGALIGFLLANSEVIVIGGNVAGIVVSLCAVAVWCFLRGRFAFAGILCLAISLAIKPQDTGFVWLLFLLAGGEYRKRALQTLLAATVVCLPGVLWVWHVAPRWMQELQSNIAAFSVHGGTNDPGLASAGAHGLGMVISLQAITSVFWDNPGIYNSVSYLIFGLLLLTWGVTTLRCRMSRDSVYLALAAIAALSMLPVYHRQYDAKLLLLTIPGCAMLCSEGGLIGKLAVLVNTLGFVLTGDIPWAILLGIIGKMPAPATRLSGEFLTAAQVFPAPLMLLVMGIFYLWVYVKRCFATSQERMS